MASFYHAAGGFCSLGAGITEIDYRLLGWNVRRWYFKASVSVVMEERAVPLLDTDVRVSALGSFRVYVNDTPLELKHKASRKVMIVLLLSEKHCASRETLAGIIWPDSTRSKSLANLRQSLLSLKKSLQPLCGDNSLLQADLQSIELVNCSVTLDTQELLSKVRHKQSIDADSQIAKHFFEGYASELKSGSDLFIEWLAASENAYLDELKNALQEAIESLDSTDVKLQYANFLSTLDACNELACRVKMQIYHGNGEKAKALSCYSELWRVLEELFDVEPSHATQELAVAIKIDEGQTKNIELGTQIVLSENSGENLEVGFNKGGHSPPGNPNASETLVPRVAVIPFVGRGVTKEQKNIGEVLADDLINVFSVCKTISVISRLSTSAFSGLTGHRDAIKLLQVQYLMGGTYRVQGEKFILDVEFSCADTASILWQKRFSGTFNEFLSGDHPFVEDALKGMGIGVMTHELRKTCFRPIEELENYTLLISAVALMHRLTADSFKKSRILFEALIDRNAKNALPYAYLAEWYVLKVGNGWSDSPNKDGQIADQLSRTALDLDPFLSLAHTFRGSVNTTFKKNLQTAERNYTTALEYNPSDSMAWLLRGTLYAFQGKGEEGVSDTSKAIALSPFDPHRYFYYSLAGTSALVAGDYKEAIQLTERSLRLNSKHTSSLRALTVALWKDGREEESRKVARRLLEVLPKQTVSLWLKETPCADYPIAEELASAMLGAGIPK